MSFFTRKSKFLNNQEDLLLDKFEDQLFNGKYELVLTDKELRIHEKKLKSVYIFDYSFIDNKYIINNENHYGNDVILDQINERIELLKICIHYEHINDLLDNDTFEIENGNLHNSYSRKLKEITEYRDMLLSDLNKLEKLILSQHHNGELIDETQVDIYDYKETKSYTIKDILTEYKYILHEVQSNPPLFHLTYRNIYKLNYLIDLFESEIERINSDMK